MAEYFPNNIKAVNQLPEEILTALCDEFTVEEFAHMKTHEWELQSSTCGLIRATNFATNNVTEYSYQREYAFSDRVEQLLGSDDPMELLVIAGTTYTVLANERRANDLGMLDNE